MQYTILPPREPGQPEPVRPPMIYIEKKLKWEYKQVERNLESEGPIGETELNKLGEEGWEMCGFYTVNLSDGLGQQFYFKRSVD